MSRFRGAPGNRRRSLDTSKGSFGDAHGMFERLPHLRRLAIAVPERPQARLQQGIFVVLLERDPLDAFPLLEERQLDAARNVGIADDGLGLLTLGAGIEI